MHLKNCFVRCTSLKTERIRPDSGTQQFRIFRYGCDFANGRKRKNYKLRAGGEDKNTSAGCVAHTARTGGKGYVERSVDKKDRRNTYISLTEKGWKKGKRYGTECRTLAAL